MPGRNHTRFPEICEKNDSSSRDLHTLPSRKSPVESSTHIANGPHVEELLEVEVSLGISAQIETRVHVTSRQFGSASFVLALPLHFIDGTFENMESSGDTPGSDAKPDVVSNEDFETLKYQLLGPSLTKAGQDSVDQQKVGLMLSQSCI